MIRKVIGKNIPVHIAIIMDGNGRWAKSKNMPRTYGHSQGSNNLEKVCSEADKLGVKYVTVYAFSTENWNRPTEEVEALMNLLRKFLKDSIKKAKKNNMRVRIIGNREQLDKDIRDSINTLEEATKDLSGLSLQIALNYGSRDEMVRAMKNVINKIENKVISIEDINEDLIEKHLDTEGIPNPDLLIRTSGEQRLSNFLLWQLAYSEFYFTDKHWPEFGKKDLIEAIEHYNNRDRRFGKI
ncbi:undecaprenyl diphosphate synthase [Natranaerovirga pectinivora]|uniref:Isoprenyl transferase n=1 Tax=Natranaerovirga pectinivora TaxID=682400 RepID=A0A4R3MLY8_9FIRM|nr:isoprenyl transferase [Natranaerovirga pectinivora]TCT15066.1 undecaprenyl diphosphate synthase [Natranaerovirga pectinivora]